MSAKHTEKNIQTFKQTNKHLNKQTNKQTELQFYIFTSWLLLLLGPVIHMGCATLNNLHFFMNCPSLLRKTHKQIELHSTASYRDFIWLWHIFLQTTDFLGYFQSETFCSPLCVTFAGVHYQIHKTHCSCLDPGILEYIWLLACIKSGEWPQWNKTPGLQSYFLLATTWVLWCQQNTHRKTYKHLNKQTNI